jgi:hypothetical protein
MRKYLVYIILIFFAISLSVQNKVAIEPVDTVDLKLLAKKLQKVKPPILKK